MTAITFPEYAEFEKIVFSAIHSVHREIGGDLDEMLSAAGMLFVKAVACYNDQRGMTLSTWIRKVAWDDTFAARRIEIGRKKKYESGEVDLEQIRDMRSEFNFSEFMTNLSDDARNLVMLTIDTPAEVIRKHDGTPKKSSLMAMARRLYGWTNEQLTEIREEIAASL